jgi:acyl-CoA thioesterase-1
LATVTNEQRSVSGLATATKAHHCTPGHVALISGWIPHFVRNGQPLHWASWRTALDLLTLLAIGLLLNACGGAASQPTPTPQSTPTPAGTLKIMAVGDSLTEGYGVADDETYPAQLEAALHAAGYAVTVVNAGVSGETSSGTRQRIDWLLQQQPDIVILAIGGNDGLRGIDPALTEQNIEHIVQRIQASGAVVVLPGMEMVRNLGSEYVSAFRAIYPRVAERTGVILMPFFLDGVAGDRTLSQPDFIHPTGAGYAIVVKNLLPYVEQAVKQAQVRR